MDIDWFVDNNYELFFKKMFWIVFLIFFRSIWDENYDMVFLNYIIFNIFNINYWLMYNSLRDVRLKVNIKYVM